MEEAFKVITNLNLEIKPDCPEHYINVLKSYWEIEDEEYEFTNSVKSIKRNYSIDQSTLNSINRNHSKFNFYLLCDKCNSYERKTVFSQSAFKSFVSYTNPYSRDYTCKHCKSIIKAEEDREIREKYKKISEKADLAIKNKNWENLSNFDKEVLLKCLELDFNKIKKHFGNQLGLSNFYQLIISLENIEHQGFIHLVRNSYNNYIDEFILCSNQLVDYKEEIIASKKIINQGQVDLNEVENSLKFRLSINEYNNHPDKPLYAGTVEFKKKIVINPNEEYAFAHWKRANDDVFLTLIPVTEIEKRPLQKKLSEQPKTLKNQLSNFLNNINIDK